MKNIDEIIKWKEDLDMRCKIALSNMALSGEVRRLAKEVKEMQAQCPHFSEKYNFVQVDNKCPYCGKELE